MFECLGFRDSFLWFRVQDLGFRGVGGVGFPVAAAREFCNFTTPTLKPKPYTLHPKPKTLNPTPKHKPLHISNLGSIALAWPVVLASSLSP